MRERSVRESEEKREREREIYRQRKTACTGCGLRQVPLKLTGPKKKKNRMKEIR